MAEINNQLPSNVGKFFSMFPPSARLCRFINRRSGTLLDVRPNLDVVNDDVPQVVGNPESAGVQYWLITPYGSGQAIIPVPKDGSLKVRYLTPSTSNATIPVTISPFPTSWILMPTATSPSGTPLVSYSVPQGLYEQWTCLISWPHFSDTRMLDLWAGVPNPNQPVVVYPVSGTQWQCWHVQFIRHRPMNTIPPILPSDLMPTLSIVEVPTPPDDG